MHLKLPVWLLKVGGRLCDTEACRQQVAQLCARARLHAEVVLVHGGGSSVDALQRALGLQPQYVEGRRHTPPSAMAAVEMALSGGVNKALVRSLQACGLAAVGLSGVDDTLVRCTLVPDLGCVGTPHTVQPGLLHSLLALGRLPVVSPVSVGPDGAAVNVNADEFAAALAAGLQAQRLLLLTDVDAVRLHSAAQRSVAAEDLAELIAAGEITCGMIPKLRAAATALEQGVGSVWLGGVGDALSAPEEGRGTFVVRAKNAAAAVSKKIIGTASGAASSESLGSQNHKTSGQTFSKVTSSPDVQACGNAALRPENELFAGVFAFPRLHLSHGLGSHVWDQQGKRYLDFTAGLGVLALGHRPPGLAEVVQAQCTRLWHVSNLFAHTPGMRLADALLQAAPWAARVWLCNSGAEANEAAFKFARLWGRAHGGPQRHAVIAFERGFHGRTLGAVALTHTPAYREPFDPGVPGVRYARFNDIESVRAAMDPTVCAILVEPVQGEGGVHPATPEFLRGLRALCDAQQVALILDEVQCGLGRTGRLFAYEHSGVLPDMLCLAKPLAAGLPLGATLVSPAVAALLHPGQHGSTFGGNPLACAVAVEVVRTLADGEFLQAVRAKGERLAGGLRALVKNSGTAGPFAAQRGLGLMQALAVADPTQHDPGRFVQAARGRGLLLSRAGADAVRLLPPLTCSDAEIDQALGVLQEITSAA
jgi:acetylornithine/N-succinyldiaminopimelate aminotransferase